MPWFEHRFTWAMTLEYTLGASCIAYRRGHSEPNLTLQSCPSTIRTEMTVIIHGRTNLVHESGTEITNPVRGPACYTKTLDQEKCRKEKK